MKVETQKIKVTFGRDGQYEAEVRMPTMGEMLAFGKTAETEDLIELTARLIVGWDLEDESGKPIPPSDLLSLPADLYIDLQRAIAEEVFRPFAESVKQNS